MWDIFGARCNTHTEVRAASKGRGFSLPAVLTDEVIKGIGGVKLIEPDYSPLSQVAEYTIEDGTQVWTVRDKTEAELQAMRAGMVVTMAQALKALFLDGITEADIETAINALDNPDRTLAMIDFKRSDTVRRLSPWVAMLADHPLIDKDAAALDQLFDAAAAL